MWLKVNGTNQEIFDVHLAQKLIDQGATAIPTPPGEERAAPDFVPPTTPQPERVAIPREVLNLVQNLGLANQPQSYDFAKRFLNLEKAVAQLELSLIREKLFPSTAQKK